MKEKIVIDYKRIIASIILFLFIWLFSHIPSSAGTIPIIKGDWSYKVEDTTFSFDSSSLPEDVGFIIVRSSSGVNYGFFYSANPFSLNFDYSVVWDNGYSQINNLTFNSQNIDGLNIYSTVFYAYGYSNHSDNVNFYHAISSSTNSMTPSLDLIKEVVADIISGDILTNNKMSADFISSLFPKELYSPSIGGLVIKKDSFKEINLKSGVGSESHGISGNVNVDKEYQIGIDRYSSTGLDLFYNPVPPHYSNSKFNKLRIHVYAQPDISCFYSDGSIFHPSEHNKTFDFDYINRVNFNCTYSVKRSALMDLIKTSLSEINSIRGELADSSDNILITWKLYFRIEGKLSDSNDTFYGDICKVSFNSKFTSHGYDETPTATIDYGSFNSNGSSDFDFVASESNESLTLTGSASSGVSWEEGYINNSGSIGGSPIQTAEDLMGQIKGIPEIISSLFSFMPSWVLAMYSVGFGLLLVLIGYKLIRG